MKIHRAVIERHAYGFQDLDQPPDSGTRSPNLVSMIFLPVILTLESGNQADCAQ